MRVTVDRDVVLESDVKPFEVFAHKHDVDVVISPAGNQRACWTQVRVELELFA